MPVFRCLILALGLCVATAHAGTRVLPPDAVLVDATTTKPDAARLAIAAGEVLARVDAGDAEGAFARLSAIADPVAFELAAARVVEALMARPRPAGERLLAKLEAIPVRVFHRHEETAADWFLPLVDVAARARSARRVIAANAARDAALAALTADPVATVVAASTSKRADDESMAAAIALLSQDKVDVLAAAVANRDATLASPPLVQLALRSAHAPVWMQALERAAPQDVLPLFAAVDTVLADADALAWLQAAAQDARYTSAAVMATGRLATTSREASAALDAYLGRTDTGPSAAAALALHAGPAFLADIDRRLAKTGDALRVQHLALALRLADTPAAEARLRALRDDPRLPAAAKAELQR